MTAHRSRRPLTVTTLATATVVALAGCGGSAPVVHDETPVAAAEPLVFEASHLEPLRAPEPSESPSEPAPDAADVPDPPQEASPGPPEAVGPSSADAAAFIAAETGAGLEHLEHVVVDLDGDDVSEVVVTGIRERRVIVRVAWWMSGGGGYEVVVTDEAGPGREVTALHAADVTQDGRIELLVTVEGEGRQSLAVWSVDGPGKVEPLEAVGGCAAGRHVFGLTTARLQGNGEDPPAIVADCDESPLPVADWSDHRWVWLDGAYRHVEPDVDEPGPPEDPGDGEGGPPGSPGGGQGDGGEGRGSGQGTDGDTGDEGQADD